jgi:hypothetical protein
MKRMTKWLMPIVILAVFAGACGKAEQPVHNNPTTGAGQNTQSGPNDPTASNEPVEAQQMQTIDVYYTDDELQGVVSEKVEIEFADQQEKIEAALAALQQDGGDHALSLWKFAVIQSISISDGDVTVDLSLPDEAKLGSTGESLALEAIKKTLFQFDEVLTLDLLLDGEAVESLMGHEGLEHPFQK